MTEAELQARLTARQSKVFDVGVPTVVAMSADQCKKACDKMGKEYLPGYEGRVLKYITTNEVTDRYGDIVRACGAKLDNYKKNPVVMFSHQHDHFPVGASLSISIDKKCKNIPAEALFLDDRVDNSGRSDLVYKFAKSGFMPACSIGLMPLKANRPSDPQERTAMGLGEWGVEFTEWDYLEFSPCAIPANPEALAMAIKSCDLTTFNQDDIDKLSKVNFMAYNLLDQFVENIKGNTGKIYTYSKKDSSAEVVPPAATPDPVTIEQGTAVVALPPAVENKATPEVDLINQAIATMNESLTIFNTKLDSILNCCEALMAEETSDSTDGGSSEEVEADMYTQAFDNIFKA